MDNATHGREWTTTASDKSGRGTTGRRRSSKINDHTVLNLSPFTVIFDNTERTQRQPRCGEGVLRTGTFNLKGHNKFKTDLTSEENKPN